MKLTLPLTLAVAALTANGAILTFNAAASANNAATQAAFVTAIGETPDVTINFNGRTDGTSIHDVNLGFGFRLRDTNALGGNVVAVECTAGGIGGSNPVGACAAEHDERAYLQFSFANPIDYVSFVDIDSSSTTVFVDFVGGSSTSFLLDSTAGGGNSAEFVGIFRNNMPRIIALRLDAAGDGAWGVDNISFGTNSGVPEPSTMGLLSAGAAALTFARHRTRRS